MKIVFHLTWLKAGHPVSRAFKLPSYYSLLSEYASRIKHFFPTDIQGGIPKPEGPVQIWLCDRTPGSKMLSSEDLAHTFQKVRDSSISNLAVVIGGPDGFDAKALQTLKPNLRWSFGSLTLPHELASVVAAEQIYRALTILKGMPYHSGHK